MRLVFVVPDPAAMVSGGNVYNAALVAALAAAGATVTMRALDDDDDDDPAARYFVDSLYLDALPRLRRLHRHVQLVAHYLPSLVRLGRVPERGDLSASEREAIDAAGGFVVPSRFMADALAALGAASRPITVVAPGIVVPAPAPFDAHASTLRAILVANVVPTKRVLELVEALAPAVRSGARVELVVAGSVTMDPAYARACRDRVASEPALAAAIRFAGAVAHEALLGQLAASDVLVSTSCMESFGLALAEARALGVPILARSGGNVAAHVDSARGGLPAASAEEPAAGCVALARDRQLLGQRRAAAERGRPPPRSWATAARDFLDAQRAFE